MIEHILEDMNANSLEQLLGAVVLLEEELETLKGYFKSPKIRHADIKFYMSFIPALETMLNNLKAIQELILEQKNFFEELELARQMSPYTDLADDISMRYVDPSTITLARVLKANEKLANLIAQLKSWRKEPTPELKEIKEKKERDELLFSKQLKQEHPNTDPSNLVVPFRQEEHIDPGPSKRSDLTLQVR